MSRRHGALHRKDEQVIIDEESEEEEEEEKPKKGKGAKQGPPPKKDGLNWTAIILLGMMILPAIITAYVQIMDYLYPTDAIARRIRERVVKCYEAANPSKLKDVDRFIEKYKGNEHKLFAVLKGKYEKVPECQ